MEYDIKLWNLLKKKRKSKIFFKDTIRATTAMCLMILPNFDCEKYVTEENAIFLESAAINLLSSCVNYHRSHMESNYFWNEFINEDRRSLFCYAFWYPVTSKKFGFEVGRNCTNCKDT